ncbi:hypothetical protein Tco_0780388 [Tanacetum coccineum]
MSESSKRYEENSNFIKEIRSTIDVAIRNQGASIKTLEIQIGQMSKMVTTRRNSDDDVPNFEAMITAVVANELS